MEPKCSATKQLVPHTTQHFQTFPETRGIYEILAGSFNVVADWCSITFLLALTGRSPHFVITIITITMFVLWGSGYSGLVVVAVCVIQFCVSHFYVLLDCSVHFRLHLFQDKEIQTIYAVNIVRLKRISCLW